MQKNDKPSDAERRVARRLQARFAGRVERGGHNKRICLIRNLSTSGALLLTRTRLRVGDAVNLELFVREDEDKPHTARGRIVRIEPLGFGELDPWLLRAAVQFDAPVKEVLQDVEALEDKQVRLGISSIPPPR